jgi:DNA-binding MarR family transcriptional regulator
LGSPATLHKRLKRLIAKDLIQTRYQGDDKRTKYLEPTEKGLAFVKWLDSNMLTAQAGPMRFDKPS